MRLRADTEQNSQLNNISLYKDHFTKIKDVVLHPNFQGNIILGERHERRKSQGHPRKNFLRHMDYQEVNRSESMKISENCGTKIP